jgi:hypothetical protein
VRGVVRDKIQKQENLESQEKEKADKGEQERVNDTKLRKEKRRPSNEEETPRKRHRTMSLGKQEKDTMVARSKTPPTPARRLKSLDSEPVPAKSRIPKAPLRQSRSLEGCNITSPWVVAESPARPSSRVDRAGITESWLQSSPMPDHTAIVQELLDDLISSIVEIPPMQTNKRCPVEDTGIAKRLKINKEETTSDVDPICEDFEAFPVHFDDAYISFKPESPEDTKVMSCLDNSEQDSDQTKTCSSYSESQLNNIEPRAEGGHMLKASHQTSPENKISYENPMIEEGPVKDFIVATGPDEDFTITKVSHTTRRNMNSKKCLKTSWMTTKKREHLSTITPKEVKVLEETEGSVEMRSEELYKVFNFEEDQEEDMAPTMGKILELVEDEGKEKPCVEQDSGNGSDRDEDDMTDLTGLDYLNMSKDSVGINSDIWNSINEDLMGLSSSKEDVHKGEHISEKSSASLESSISKKADYDWPDGLGELKDEFADDNTDIWASTNEMMNEISISLDVSPLQPKVDQKPHDVSPSRKSRSKRKRHEENLGNPDSGKENADGDNVENEETVSESKKHDRVLSPANKRKKDVKAKSSRTSKDASPPASPSKRPRSSSQGPDEGGHELKVAAEKSTKPVAAGRLSATSHKTIQIIDPIPLTSPPDSANMDKTLTKSAALVKKKINVSHEKKEKSKTDKKERRKQEETKSEGKSKSSKSPSTSKLKSDWSRKPQTMSHPSSSLVKYYDNEYDRLKSKPETSKSSRRPSK